MYSNVYAGFVESKVKFKIDNLVKKLVETDKKYSVLFRKLLINRVAELQEYSRLMANIRHP